MCLLRRKLFLIAWLILLLCVQSAQAQKVRYFYDDLGRLIGVVDEQGNAAQYVYDEVGNILEIRRTNVADFTGQVAITFFDPDRGQVGTEITIFGIGFSDTPGENTIAFNGVSVPVLAASTSNLTTQVPDGATTGPITVTTPLGSATSQENFTVSQSFALVPDQADVVLGGTVGFQASLDGNPTSAVIWRVNGIESGTAELGTITSEGIYTAPSSPPPVQPVHVEAVLTTDSNKVATARVDVFPTSAGSVSTAAQLSVAPLQAATASPLTSPAVSVVPIQPAMASPLTAPVVSVAPLPSVAANPLSARSLSVSAVPVLNSVNPESGDRGTSVLVTLAGVGLNGATALLLFRDGAADPSIIVSDLTVDSSGTTLTATLTIDTTAPFGDRVIQVTASGRRSTPVTFKVK